MKWHELLPGDLLINRDAGWIRVIIGMPHDTSNLRSYMDLRRKHLSQFGPCIRMVFCSGNAPGTTSISPSFEVYRFVPGKRTHQQMNSAFEPGATRW